MGVCAVENSMLFILDIIISAPYTNHRQGRSWGVMLRSQSEGCGHAV